MAATLTSILLHVTLSTKHREPITPLDLRNDVFRFIGGVCREMNSPLLHAGGTQDHIHLLVSLAKKTSVADLMLHVKRSSSAWIKNQRPGLHLFAWQDGYFAFSVGHESVDAVRAYLDRQLEHHRGTTFQEETLAFLTKYGVTFDPRYLWE